MYWHKLNIYVTMADGLNNFFQSLGGKLGNAMGNPTAQKKPGVPTSGPVRSPFLTPENLLSSVYFSTGYSRTLVPGGFLSQSPAIALEEDRSKSVNGVSYPRVRLQKPGFTPINYYRTVNGEVFLDIPENLKTTSDKFSETIKSYDEYGDISQSGFKFSLSDYVNFFGSQDNKLETPDGGPGNNPWDSGVDQNPTKLSFFNQTPYDNEDPVWFGFEIILNVQTSPLLNGELEKFIAQFGDDYTEVGSRSLIVNQFKTELFKYFKLSTGVGTAEGYDPTRNIMATDIYGQGITPTQKRWYYVRKVQGLEKLVENNTSSQLKSFIEYGKDILTISFFEDTTLNLGTLASLYKLMYWSKLRGKSLIPENLLRFDCEIVVSELRDFVRLKKSGNMVEYLRSNLTRYRYQLYECQFWFNKMSHPDAIDMTAIDKTDSYDVEISYKYSNMIFERYNPNLSAPGYVRLRDSTIDPLSIKSGSISSTFSSGGNVGQDQEYVGIISSVPNDEKSLGSYDNLSSFNISANSNNYSSTIEDVSNVTNDPILDAMRKNQKSNIYGYAKAPNASAPPISSKQDVYGKAAEALLENLKKSALNEAQRQLNTQFRLLNNSIDDIRNSFGIGRMSAPTNIYNIPPGGQFFFDVQNSLRNFGGDVLTGIIGG